MLVDLKDSIATKFLPPVIQEFRYRKKDFLVFDDSHEVHSISLIVTRVSQLKIWHFRVIGIERNICSCTFNRYSGIMQFVKLATGEQLCRRCTHRKL